MDPASREISLPAFDLSVERQEELLPRKQAPQPRRGRCGVPAPEERSATWAQVKSMEDAVIGELRRARGLPDSASFSPRRRNFSVAFSGGGMRAAAFQAGVLWRLAEMDLLGNVDYLAAVSGGGYIASAFATHCAAEPMPTDGSSKEWYLRVVAKTICRMQRNAGNFVRDCSADPGTDSDGAGCLPRVLDLPILLLTVVTTVLVHPILFVVGCLVPATVFIDNFFGDAMRTVFCTPANEWMDLCLWRVFGEAAASPLSVNSDMIVGLTLLSVLLYVLRSTMPCCKLRWRPGQRRPIATTWYHLGHSLNACTVRFAVFLSLFVAFVALVLILEMLSYSPPERSAVCEMAKGGVDFPSISQVCIRNGTAPVQDLSSFGSNTFWNSSRQGAEPLAAHDNDGDETLMDKVMRFLHMFLPESYGLTSIIEFVAATSMAFTFALCIFIPCFGANGIFFIFKVVGPVMVFLTALTFSQIVLFSGVTGNMKGATFLHDLTPQTRDKFIGGCLICSMIVVPFYEEIRALMHYYYKRTLSSNFFARGADIRITALANVPSDTASSSGSCFSPFLILTVTSSDYQPPGADSSISEVMLTPLHCGSEDTGFITQPHYRSLAKCTALSGAGCLDAISLSMSNALSMRFWLQALNLSWGDYLLFEKRSRLLDFAERRAIRTDWRLEGAFVRGLHRVPGALSWMAFYVLVFLAWKSAGGVRVIHTVSSDSLFQASIWLLIFLLASGFFSFVPVINLLSASAMSRLWLMLTKYFYVGHDPPRMLYVTDGGVMDCTGVVQLMRRRSERILLVFAAGDAEDDLEVLKAAMALAERERIGSFFDPRDPRGSVGLALRQFKEDKKLEFLRLGVWYGWEEDGSPAREAKTGVLIIVKNRMPEGFENHPVEPLLTEEEIRGESPTAPRRSTDIDLYTDQLGPFGCCDCCHSVSCLNCGPKFPAGTFTNYLYLTPTWCSSSVRLGHALGKSGIQQLIAEITLEH